MGEKIFNHPDSLASNNITINVFRLDRSEEDKSSDKNAKNQPNLPLSAMSPFPFFGFFHVLIEIILNLPIEFMLNHRITRLEETVNKLKNISVGQNNIFTTWKTLSV